MADIEETEVAFPLWVKAVQHVQRTPGETRTQSKKKASAF